MDNAEVEFQKSDEHTDERERWNSFLSDPKNRRVDDFWKEVRATYQGDVPLPLALPGAEPGSVQLAWDTDEYHLDVTIPSDGPQEWFFMDRQTGEQRDGVWSDDAKVFEDLFQIVARG